MDQLFNNFKSSLQTFLNDTLYRVVVAILFLLVFFLLYTLISKGLKKVLYRKKKPTLLVKFIATALKCGAVFFGILIAADILGIPNASIIALLSTAALAVGLTLQGVASNLMSGMIMLNGSLFKEGDYISLNGSTGEVYQGEVPTKAAEVSGNFAKLMDLCNKYTRLQVRTNADTPHDAEVARKFGAVGIGLCRTEHMFFENQKIIAMREMILAPDVEGRKKALAKLLPYQKNDFKGIFKAMDGYPVNIRLLDPPLHEFVPHDQKGQEEMAEAMGVTVEYIRQRVDSLCEHNPMLGHRGCRLGNTYPEITEMQTEAILGAACELKKEGHDPHPEIMVPLIGILYEFEAQEKIIRATAKRVFEQEGIEVPFKVGTMIEIPRAALTANRIASHAEYFSFGTNDLTQMTFGYSRDDIATFLPVYLEKKILKVDPFQVLDQNGVGQLIKMAVEKGRSVRPELKCGICGEHGGEPSSVKFCDKVGLNYVSCSPFRVPIARLAAAQAAIEDTL